MRSLFAGLVFAGQVWGGVVFQTGFDAPSGWLVVQGTAAVDPAVTHDGAKALRVESNGADAVVRVGSLKLSVGRSYELTGWVRTERLRVSDTGRSPIATGAMLQMASMPFDVHSESVAGTHDWRRLHLRFTATDTQDSVLLSAGLGGSVDGKAWFSGLQVDEAEPLTNWPTKAALKTFGPAYRFPMNGWIYLHIEGEPYERGYQHGWLMSKEIPEYLERCAAQLDPKSRDTAWRNGRTAANALFLRGFDQEILAEMKGIAEGAAAVGAKFQGRPVDLIDIVTANTIVELGELDSAMPMTTTGLEGTPFRRPKYAEKDVPVTARCSAFAATGKATKDGKMVIGHITMWPLTLAEQTNVWLDIQPAKGRRVFMQSYPGGIESGTDWYQNDAGIVLTETTIRQSPFNSAGTPVAFRARKAIQYSTSIDQMVEYLGTKNNGLYTNEWILGDAKTNEIAMYELGTYKTKLYRSSRGDWYGGTEGFYWGDNNAKDLAVRLEYVPDPHGTPEYLPFVPYDRDITWQKMYEQYKGHIDDAFAFLAFRTAPLVTSTAMDAKVTSADMAMRGMAWVEFGRPNQREWLPSRRQREEYADNQGLYPGGYRLADPNFPEAIQARIAAVEQERRSESAAAKANTAKTEPPQKFKPIDPDQLWKGWILPETDADVWLAAGSAIYYSMLQNENLADLLDEHRAAYRAAAHEGDQPLLSIRQTVRSGHWFELASHKGVLTLDALRRQMGNDRFLTLMRDFFAANTTRSVNTAAFRKASDAAMGSSLDGLYQVWLERAGLPELPDGPRYTASALRGRLQFGVIVYGTVQEAGANRYAAEQLQRQLQEQYEDQVMIVKDFDADDRLLAAHDVYFVGRPETNQALAAWAGQLGGVEFDGGGFRYGGKDHASEREALWYAFSNPLNRDHMALVFAGNSPLETVRLVMGFRGRFEYGLSSAGRTTETGFLR